MYKIQQERLKVEMSQTPYTHTGGVLPIAPTSTWATRISGKRKTHSSVDKQDVWYHQTKKVEMKVRLNTHNCENNRLSTNWMRTTLNGERCQLRTQSGLQLSPKITNPSITNYKVWLSVQTDPDVRVWLCPLFLFLYWYHQGSLTRFPMPTSHV
jgi:hypothetical protein